MGQHITGLMAVKPGYLEHIRTRRTRYAHEGHYKNLMPYFKTIQRMRKKTEFERIKSQLLSWGPDPDTKDKEYQRNFGEYVRALRSSKKDNHSFSDNRNRQQTKEKSIEEQTNYGDDFILFPFEDLDPELKSQLAHLPISDEELLSFLGKFGEPYVHRGRLIYIAKTIMGMHGVSDPKKLHLNVDTTLNLVYQTPLGPVYFVMNEEQETKKPEEPKFEKKPPTLVNDVLAAINKSWQSFFLQEASKHYVRYQMVLDNFHIVTDRKGNVILISKDYIDAHGGDLSDIDLSKLPKRKVLKKPIGTIYAVSEESRKQPILPQLIDYAKQEEEYVFDNIFESPGRRMAGNLDPLTLSEALETGVNEEPIDSEDFDGIRPTQRLQILKRELESSPGIHFLNVNCKK